MTNNRPINQIRDSAITMSVGGDNDASAITSMFAIGGVMHAIKESSIYEIRLADDIDPKRTNELIPNTQQKVLGYGSESEMVGRVLLTAKTLFSKSYLPKSFDTERALALAFDVLKDVVALQELATAFDLQQTAAINAFEGRRRQDSSLLLPAVGDVSVRCKTFAQKADHSLQSLLNIVRLFYGEEGGRKWFESLADIAAQRYGKDDPFSDFLAKALPFLRFIRNVRNCAEHPKPAERIINTDFALGADGVLSLPTIEVLHPKTAEPPVAVSVFMQQITDQIITVFEIMTALMSDKHVQVMSGFPIQVVELPERQRAEKHVRYCYGMYNGDHIIQCG